MESIIKSRKRKQRPSESDPFGGIFTRSKSQIYFHRHRSGYARSDSNRIRNLIKSRKGKAKSTVKQQKSGAITVDQVTSQGSVIDLRARRVFSPAAVADEVDLEGELDVCKKSDGNPSVLVSDLEVSGSVVVDLQAGPENIVDSSSAREDNVMEGDDGVVVVQMTSVVAESEENRMSREKDEMITTANKSQPLVTSLRGRKKLFKSPTSFNYRRLLPYLMDPVNDDSSSIELVEAALPKSLKSSNLVTDMVILKDDEVGPVSNSSKLADGLLNKDTSSEKQISNSVNVGLNVIVESSDVVQKIQEEVVNDTLNCEQMTPPDSNIFSESKIDNVSGVLVKPTCKPVLKSCSRQKLLLTPTSFSHRRLLPFLMSAAEDYSCSLKDDQSLKIEKATEQNQQLPTQLLRQEETSTTADETSNSPTSTLIPVDTTVDITKVVALVSNDNILDANGPDKEGTGSISQLEVNSQGEAVKSVSYIKIEQSPPKTNLKSAEDATLKATPLCNEQGLSENCLKKVKESPTSKAASLCIEQSFSEGCLKTVKESPTFKAAPLCIEQRPSEDHRKIVKGPTFKATPLYIEQSFNENPQKKVKESPQHLLQIAETQGENVKNGILKRTPRGCRGICNCLNCTSFRLHAERSFEFSKNQMHDAEEVALELMNELSCLRNIIETTSRRSNSHDNVKEKQVKEACAKALYKEQEARARLAQMNDDLSIHCRSMNLLRPKVTFANKIEEKFISKR